MSNMQELVRLAVDANVALKHECMCRCNDMPRSCSEQKKRMRSRPCDA